MCEAAPWRAARRRPPRGGFRAAPRGEEKCPRASAAVGLGGWAGRLGWGVGGWGASSLRAAQSYQTGCGTAGVLFLAGEGLVSLPGEGLIRAANGLEVSSTNGDSGTSPVSALVCTTTGVCRVEPFAIRRLAQRR